MSVIGGVVVYAISWWILLLVILPRGVQTQIESGEIEPGTPGGAPAHRLPVRRKLLWISLAALIPFGIFWILIEYQPLTLNDFDFLFPASFKEPPA